MARGLVQVYTGDGKGKSTAAWGQALRAVGQGMRVAIVQFLKPSDSGEVKAAECLKQHMYITGQCRAYDPNVSQRDSPDVREDNRKNFATASDLIRSASYDMVVLDEIVMALHYEHIAREEMTDLIRQRPTEVEIVLTGRNAPTWLIDQADLVTEMRDVKHPASKGIAARKGIEY